MAIDEFFKLDNQIIAKDFIIKESNLLLWPLIRWKVMSYIISKKNSLSVAHANQSKFSVKNFRYIYNSFKYATHRKKKERNVIFFYISARGRINSINFNIYSDYYSSLSNKILVIERSFRGNFFIPKRTNNFATGEYGRLKAFLFYNIKKLFSKKNSGIERFIKFLKTNDDIDEDFAGKVRKKLYFYYYGYTYYRTYIEKIFKKLKPKVIFVHTGVYGKFESLVLKIAKENGIKTGEFQHGAISKNHVAYNFGESIFQSEQYQKYLPDYLLTYGDFWNSEFKIPSKKVTIGNPHFYENIKKYSGIKERKHTILIVSQGVITDKFIKIAKYLSKELKDYRIIFKLHPGEVPFEDRYKELYEYNNIEIVKSGDIYKYIALCENVIACYSTSIYESLGFNKKLFILDNDMSKKNIPEDIGVRFKENEELKDLILNTKERDINYNLEYYFNSNWEDNYKRFLREEVGIK